MYSSLEEALKAKVSKQEAKIEIEKHGSDFKDFLLEVGEKNIYKGSEVLYWLGY